jgi:L-cysteine:1D-myo-inositol 2-amino-2-deoxy-alpha-D-glucopyranoside ligase
VKSWNRPEVPRLVGAGTDPQLWDSATRSLISAKPVGAATLYVCGITPYDSTHIGHAATYLAYDTIIRLWLDAGHEVRYAQNTTDVDDPLLERARITGVDWRELAADQTNRFRRDMESLRIIPPDHYIAVTERIAEISAAVEQLLDAGIAYPVDRDYYFDSAAAAAVSPWHLGTESGLDRDVMLALSAERGGDPDRTGKRDPLDPVLWRGVREGEPSWPSALGTGRPGWHIECSVIASEFLGTPITVNGGGADLLFPHHEFSAGHTAALTGSPLAGIYSHAGLIAYRGEKMSKSLGNLVLVGDLTAGGADPRAIRLAILGQSYRENWEWTDALLESAHQRLDEWQSWASRATDGDARIVDDLRGFLSHDLDSRGALSRIDDAIAAGVDPTHADLEAIDALLGVRL